MTLYLDHTYFRSVLDDNVLLDADVLIDFLSEDQILLKLVQEHLLLANIATIFQFQCDSVVHPLTFFGTCADKFREQHHFPVGPQMTLILTEPSGILVLELDW